MDPVNENQNSLGEASESPLNALAEGLNSVLLGIYDLTIANAPIDPGSCRDIASDIGRSVGRCREALMHFTREPIPLCHVHASLDSRGTLEMLVGGNNCVACSLNERVELLDLLAPFAARDGSEASVDVLRRLAEFSATHQGDGRVVVSYPATTVSDFVGKPYNGIPMDRFEGEAAVWIWNEIGEKKLFAGTLTVSTSEHVLERVQFNVIERYRSLIRFPDPCPNCRRAGTDHDGECATPEWLGPDRSPLKMPDAEFALNAPVDSMNGFEGIHPNAVRNL